MEIVNELEAVLSEGFFWIMALVNSLFDLTGARETALHILQALILPTVFKSRLL